ncbi:MAG: PqqD family peptide modification chaperone [Armatimonadota bacterium]|nr:PqqD family peptide modification chaperone [Armatimonadota bacterium]
MQIPNRPCLAPDAQTYRRDGRYLLLSPARGAWCVVDEGGYRLALRCDGRTHWRRLAAQLATEYGVQRDRVERDVAAYLATLAQARLLTTCAEGNESEVSVAEMASPQRLPLHTVTLHLTTRCNLRCRHCYKGPAAESSACPAEPSLEAVCSRVDQVVALGARHLVLTGGETLLYPAWRQAVPYAAARVPTTLLTNATLLDEEAADLLAATGVKVQVSLDGADPATHEALRGAGTFSAVMAGLERLLGRGLGERLIAAICVTAHNVQTAHTLAAWALDQGVGCAYLIPVQPRGEALTGWGELAVDAADLRGLWERLQSVMTRFPGRVRLADCEGRLAAAALGPARLPCPAAHGETALVDSDGWVYPCALLTGREHRLGHAERDGLAGALSSPRCSRLRRAIAARPGEIAECTGCAWRRFCGGACPGLALVRSGDWWKNDGLCSFRRDVFVETVFALARQEEGRDVPPQP